MYSIVERNEAVCSTIAAGTGPQEIELTGCNQCTFPSPAKEGQSTQNKKPYKTLLYPSCILNKP